MRLASLRITWEWAPIALLSVLMQAPVVAQLWGNMNTFGPSARRYHAMAYDSQRGFTVLFGGSQGSSDFGDTWEWDGDDWTQIVASGPSARHSTAMVYDNQIARTVLFGGYNSTGYAGDTWEWGGSTWTQVNAGGPSGRGGHAMAYDSQRVRTVLFGGYSAGNGYFGDTWEWDGNSWTQVSSSGPAVRCCHAMAYDIQRNKTVMFGGYLGSQLGDTWEWDGTTWTPVSTTGPVARFSHAVAYDSQRGKTVLLGGLNSSSGPLGDTWEWDGNSWTQVVSGPVARGDHAMAYDNQRSKTVLFGGYSGTSGYLGDTWELSTSANFSNYGQGCVGSMLAPCLGLNEAGGTLAGTLAPLEYGIVVLAGSMQIVSFDIFTQSTGGTQVVPARLYPFLSGTPLASTTMTVGPTPGFYTATFAAPVQVNGAIFLAIDVSSQNVEVPTLVTGTSSAVYSRTPVSGNWGYASLNPAWRLNCVGASQYLAPQLGNLGDPLLGTSYDVTLSDAPPSTGAIMMTGLSDTLWGGISLPAALPNAAGCQVLAAPDATLFVFTSASGLASYSVTVPSSTSYIGVELFHQWAVLDAVNPLGIIVSDAGRAWLGT